ncbi:MAG: superoxide dismutase [Planctomycetota bacterium]|nr:superoxide dismutase [Planctomycetota bacterium]
MSFELPPLPFAYEALEPHISAETFRFHHDKHHAKYVHNLNDLLAKRKGETPTLEQLVCGPEGAVRRNAEQAWNHEFFFNGLSAKGGGDPPQPLADALSECFGDVKAFRDEFTKAALGHFGSGWAWLVQNQSGELEVMATHDEVNPMRRQCLPLLTCDVWEHAYYIDYRNDRGAYLDAFWKVVNWDALAQRLACGDSSDRRA